MSAMQWAVAQLAEVASIDRNTVAASQIEHGEMYVGLENITRDGRFKDVGPVSSGELKSNKFRFGPEHILYGKLRPYLAKIARPEFTGICSTDILPIRPSPQLDGAYLLRFLRTPWMVDHAASRATGINLPRLSPKELARFEIPLPPIEEQRRIAAVLDAADALRAKRRQALAKLDTLTQAIFIDMFGDPSQGRHPMVAIGDLVRSGITRGIDQPGPDVEDGVPYIKTTDFGDGVPLRSELMRAAPEIAAKFPRSVVEVGDTVICIRATVGPTLLVNEDLAGVNLSRGTARIAPSEDVLHEYLFAAVNTDHFRHQIELRLRGATFLQIPLGELKELVIPLPPMVMQAELVNRRAAVARLGEFGATQTAELDTLFASLQQRAFRGEL